MAFRPPLLEVIQGVSHSTSKSKSFFFLVFFLPIEKQRLEVPLQLPVVFLFKKADILLSSSGTPDDRTFVSSLTLKRREKPKENT